RHALGVLERQVREGTHQRWQRLVLARADHPARRGERARIARERSRRAAEGVASELVEQNDLRQRRPRRVAPRLQLPAQGPLDERAEAIANARVEGRVLAEPGL